MKTSTLRTYILKNHNGHQIIALKRGSHTVRLQYDKATQKASLWAVVDPRTGFSPTPAPLVIRFKSTYKEALLRLAELEVALFRAEVHAEGVEGGEPVHNVNSSTPAAPARLIPYTNLPEGTLGKLIAA